MEPVDRKGGAAALSAVAQEVGDAFPQLTSSRWGL